MEGFRWTLAGGHSCINLYFPGWTLDTVGKVVIAMFGVVLVAIVTEGISKLRHNLSKKSKKGGISKEEHKKIALFQTALHGVHAFSGYILMLATMTFSLELLLSVIVGLVAGYVIFGGDSYSHVTTNPCCAFLEDEANERGASSSDVSDTRGEITSCCDEEQPTTATPESVSRLEMSNESHTETSGLHEA